MKQHSIAVAIAMAAGFALATPAFANEYGEAHATHESTHSKEAHGDHAAGHATVSDKVVAEQRAVLAKSTKGKGFGPQAPRDIDSKAGKNDIVFGAAPDYTQMNLCNIHFHKNAEHKGGQFTEYAGNGNGEGYQSGYKAVIKLGEKELKATHGKICDSSHSTLRPGDTIEVHYVHSTADITPGKSLGSCLAKDVDNNPQLRVEAQVYVVVNDKHALDFGKLTKVKKVHGKYQAVNMPTDLGAPVNYIGSTTGPGYNEKGSPFQVSWSVFPHVAKVDINSVGKWCEGNQFEEDHAHGVRNLVVNKDLLSEIK
jgi:hypothetical protein